MGKPDNCEIEREGAARAILRDYGSVIGEQQARNIAWTALVGARGAKLGAEVDGGYCKARDCRCGGDLPEVRATCQQWIKG